MSINVNLSIFNKTNYRHVYKCHSGCSITMKLLSTYCPTGNALRGDSVGSGGGSSSSSCVSCRVSCTMYGVGGAWGWGARVLLSFPSLSSSTFHLSWDRASYLGGGGIRKAYHLHIVFPRLHRRLVLRRPYRPVL